MKNRLSPTDLQLFMEDHQVTGEVLQLPVGTPTVEAAAQAVGTQPEQIIKSILFLVDKRPVLAITCGTDLIDRRAIAHLYGTSHKRVKLASREMVLEFSGFEAGAIPPFGHCQSLETLVDQRVLLQQVVYGGGGAENALVRLVPEDILRLTQAQVVDLLHLKAEETEGQSRDH